jgi:hypothetical protein
MKIKNPKQKALEALQAAKGLTETDPRKAALAIKLAKLLLDIDKKQSMSMETEGKSNPLPVKNSYYMSNKYDKSYQRTKDPDFKKGADVTRPTTGKDIGLDYTHDAEPKNQVSRLQRKATAANPPYKRTERPKDPGLRNIARKNSRQEGVNMNKSLLREFIDMLEAEEASPKKTPQKKKVKSKEQPIEDKPEVDQNYPYQPEPYNF